MGTAYAVSELRTPVGSLRLAATPQGLLRIAFPRQGGAGFAGVLERYLSDPERVDWLPALDKAGREIDEYFEGKRREFSVELDLRGTPFQMRVWRELQRIPFGRTLSYSDLADRVSRRGGQRAVGAAAGANPLPVIVPCHRLIRSDGHLGGFAGGLETKRRLLAHEKSLASDWL